MNTQFEFRSWKFPPDEGEEDQINRGAWGRKLAEYFVQKLGDRGIDTAEIVAEDWGWFIPVCIDGVRIGLCCGHRSVDDDEFLCFTDPSTPVVRKFFRRVDITLQLMRLTETLHQILTSDPDIRDVVASNGN